MNVVIIEDERMAANRLAKMLSELKSDLEVLQTLESVEEAVIYFREFGMPELIFMDIQLSDGISFEIFDLVSITSPVIFTTAYDEYALNAFRVHAMDYLLKPIKKNELQTVIERFEDEQIKITPNNHQLDHPHQVKKVLIKFGQSLKVLTLNEAQYYYSENKISFYMSREGKRYPLDYSLDSLETALDQNTFFRVNRQYIVNQNSIKNMTSYSANRIKLSLDPKPHSEVIVSKDKVSRFRKWLVN